MSSGIWERAADLIPALASDHPIVRSAALFDAAALAVFFHSGRGR